MQDTDPTLEKLALLVSDSGPVDWTAAANQTLNPEARAVVRALQEIAAIARAHRELPDEDDGDEKLSAWGPLVDMKKIGRGSFGVVFRAHDPRVERDVALKLLRNDRKPAMAIDELLEEARVLARVRHENVVTVHWADVHEGRVGICMELVEGETLRELVESAPMSPEEASAVALCVCRALAAVHAAGLVHGDVKAQNVVRRQGRIVLMDFSASRRRIPPPGAESEAAGTPIYMAPELFRRALPSPASDIYALGVLVFFLVSRRYPQEASSIEELRRAHQTGARVYLRDIVPDIPEGMVTAIEKALSPEPAHRFRTAGEMEQALAGALFPAPVPPKPLSVVRWIALSSPLWLTALGFLTSRAYELFMGIPTEFSSDTLPSFLTRGIASMVPMAVYWVVYGIGVAALVGLSMLAMRFVGRRSKRLQGLVSFLPSIDPNVVATGIFLAGVAAWMVLWVAFSDLFATLARLQEPNANTRLLALDHEDYLMSHAKAYAILSLVLGISLWFVYPALKRRSQSGTWVQVMGWGCAALIVLSIVIAEIPWRVVWDNEGEVVALDHKEGFELGRNNGRVLVYVPKGLERTHWIVSESDPRLERRGVREKVFLK